MYLGRTAAFIVKYSHLHGQNGSHQMRNYHDTHFFSMSTRMTILFTVIRRTLFFKIKCWYAQFYWHICGSTFLPANLSTERFLAARYAKASGTDCNSPRFDFWILSSASHPYLLQMLATSYIFPQCICWKWNWILQNLKNNCHNS